MIKIAKITKINSCKTATVLYKYYKKHKKYGKYIKIKKKYIVHFNPTYLKIGMKVEICYLKKISKKKSWVINKILK
ncbi:MAG: 30S ribosomal protein S17 [Candidatus Vidania fulgoroideorum]